MNKSSKRWVSKRNLTPFSELDALDLNWKTHGLIFCILLRLFTLIFIHYSDIVRCQIVSCGRCFRRQQNSRSVNLKNPSIVKNLMSKLAVHVKKGSQVFLLTTGPYDLYWGTWEWASPNMGMPLYGGKFSCEHVHLGDLSCLSHVWIHKFRLNQLFS